ncbi:MAG: PQQ-binding-like beta-propeller repeat protein [Acidobacteriota bacterium]|nr:PQQ-binding-like beta-propeller repeat protein [Acidobacteriota bacterium]
MTKGAWIAAALAAFVIGISPLPTRAQEAPAADWPMYSRDLSSTRFSPLRQINTTNVSKLTQAWAYAMRPGGVGPESGAYSEVTPIVVRGVMYFPAGDKIVALDGDTGGEIWTYKLKTGLASSRGVAYWPGSKRDPARIFFASGHKIVALDAANGKPAAGFGMNGEITLKVPFAEVPTIYKNVLIIGANEYGPGEEHLHPQDEVAKGIPGDSRAFDARTGKELWDFHSVPHPGETGNNTWAGDAWKDRTGSNVWSITMSVDAKRGIVYMPIGGPAANYYGGDRAGDNLFSNTLVAVDANTGKLKWYFQTVHHELWDFDLPPEPALIDITRNGKKIPVVVQTGKSAYMFILNRVTGKSVFGVEERPVPKGNVPTEVYSPTQPFPLKPPPLARVDFKLSDMVTADDTTAQHAQACHALWDKVGGFYNEGPFTPWLYNPPNDPHPKISLIFPGATGGANWGGTASDPANGYVIVNMQNQGALGWISNNPKYKPGADNGDLLPYDRGTNAEFPGQYAQFDAIARDANGKSLGSWPCQKPPWETLVAVNANTGDVAWQVPLGITEGLPPEKQNTGRPGAFAGPIVTAGGLVFIGATGDNMFRAFDERAGKMLWSVHMPYQATAVPMTYQGRSGKQYVVIMDAGAAFGARGHAGPGPQLLVFALP